MRINCGIGADPWISGRSLGEAPEIDPSAVVRNSDFGRYTYLGPGATMIDSVFADYSYAMGANHITCAEIGKFCNIATGVRINPSNHPWWRATLHHFSYRSRSYGFDLPDDEALFAWRAQDRVVIGPDVWIGHNAIVMPGVTIGIGAAIGSGSVVTRDVPDFAIMVGVPARLLRPRFDRKLAEKMLAIAWWDWPHDALNAAVTDFRALDAEAFVEKYGG